MLLQFLCPLQRLNVAQEGIAVAMKLSGNLMFLKSEFIKTVKGDYLHKKNMLLFQRNSLLGSNK